MLLASFPSPSRSVWDVGPIPIRAYALCIIAGIIAAIWIGERRWVARGGRRGTVSDIAVWAVIFGLIGGRLYHVLTDNELYFRAGRDPWRAFYVWEGGLGIWGAIALGGVGAWIGCRRRGIKLPPFADACAPGIAVAQGIGRWGNYFNQELFGRPTTVPWAVRIDPDRPSTVPGATTYQPTFLYESLWDLALAGVLIYVDRRFKMGRGRVFALYVMGYTAGRVWIELLRIDTANHILGLRLNVWTSIIVFAGGLVYFLLHPGPRETVVEPSPEPADGDPTAAAAADPAGAPSGPADADPATADEAVAGEATAADAADVPETTEVGTAAKAGTAAAKVPPAADAADVPETTEVGTAAKAPPADDLDGAAATPTAADDDQEVPAPAGEVTPAADADGAVLATDADGAVLDAGPAAPDATDPTTPDATVADPAAPDATDHTAPDATAADPAAPDAIPADPAAADPTVPGAVMADADPADPAAAGVAGEPEATPGEQRRRRLIPAGRRKR